MRRWPLIAAVLLVALAGAWAWGSPYWTVSRLKRAADARDFAAISAHVDYPAVRESLKVQVGRRLSQTPADDPLDALASAVARRLAAPAIDAAVTPEGLQAIFATAAAGTASAPAPSGLRAEKMTLRREAFDRFTLEQRGAALVFRLDGLGWTLSEVRLADAGKRAL